MVHIIKNNKFGKKGKGIHKTGKHFKKVFDYWKTHESSVSPSKNEKEFWEMIESDAKELKEKFERGEITEEELKSQLDRMAEGYLGDDESEPSATIYFHNYEGFDEDYPYTIGHYHDNTEGEFEAKWHSTDAWRGYYEVESKDWINVHSDVALAYSEDERELKNFDDKLKEKLDEMHIPYARVFSTTSNLFSTGYDFFVKKEDVNKVKGIIEDLKKEHRDPEKFTFTALTGKDPSEAEPEDKIFVKSAKKLMRGEPFEKVKGEALEEALKMKKKK